MLQPFTKLASPSVQVTEYWSICCGSHLDDILDTYFESASFLWMVLEGSVLICAAEFEPQIFSYRIATAGFG